MDPRLLIGNVGYVASVVFTLSIAFFVIIKGKDRRLSWLFFLMSMSIAVFEVSHVLGINTVDPHVSRTILMCNLANIFIAIFVAHWILALIGIVKKRIIPLAIIYVVGILLFLYFIIFPENFLLDSVPKMYLPNYYEPAKYYWLVTAFFEIVGVYFIAELVIAFWKSHDLVFKNRIRYVFWGIFFGFIVGSSAVLLVYNIPVDPLWSMFFSLYTVPFAYAILKYDLMDIRIVAKRALFYGVAVGAVSAFISFLSYSSDWLAQNVPGFPTWTIPLLSALIAVSIAVIVWRKIRETDVLKYEFINIITHKFRTPLTRIRWSTESLLGTVTLPEQKEELQDISYSIRSLVDLTNTLVSLSNSEFSLEQYTFERINFEPFAREIVEKSLTHARNKTISLEIQGDEEIIMVNADKEKIGFVLQTLIENAITYTPPAGKIVVLITRKKKEMVCEVRDTGIGIAPENLPLVFTKFFRTPNAKEAYTEGVGIGLYMVKIIVKRHGGSISVASEGLGKGSVFSINLPLVK